MSQTNYAYSGRPTRNPFRFMLALWRSLRDLTNTHEVAIVEIGFARSRVGRRLARWNKTLDALADDARTSDAVAKRAPVAPIDLAALEQLPEATLGRTFADHCRARDLNPNLVHIEGDDAASWLLSHLYSTHDIWHVTTGWGNDETGEVGLGAFYMAQLEAPFFVFLFALILLNTALVKPSTLRERLDAMVTGYQLGKNAEPLFGVDWSTRWDRPLVQVRHEFGLEDATILGEGIRSAA